MTSKLYQVLAETHEGKTFVLRQFPYLAEAESHPVKLSLWKRVWVERIAPPVAKLPATLARPWQIEDACGRFTYIRDADGTRLMSLWGSFEQRNRLIGIFRDAGLIAEGEKRA